MAFQLRRKYCCTSTKVLEALENVKAEREGFEPPDLSVNCFQDSRLKPLGHLSQS